MEIIKICRKHKRISKRSKWIQSSASDIYALYLEVVINLWEPEAELVERKCDECKKEEKVSKKERGQK